MSQISILLLITLISLITYKCLAYKLENGAQILDESSQKVSVAKSPFYSNNDQVFDNFSDLANDTQVRSKRRVKLEEVKMASGDYKLLSLPNPSYKRCDEDADLITITKWGKTAKEYKIIVNEMEKTILLFANCKQRGGCVAHYKILKIRKVINGCLWQRYLDRKSDIELENNGEANERMLFHGTNYGFEVVNYGFDERYVGVADRSFGAGIYFATSSSAANELAFGKAKTGCPRHNRPDCNICKRNMILARVTLGKEYPQDGAKKYAHPPPGFDSVVGNLTDLRYPYNDYIVYRGEQAYPEYLITYIIRTDIQGVS